MRLVIYEGGGREKRLKVTRIRFDVVGDPDRLTIEVRAIDEDGEVKSFRPDPFIGLVLEPEPHE